MPLGSHDVGVCVIIAAENAELTVGRAVASALAQDHVEEVIVVDDGSRDSTGEGARRADDGSGRLSVICLPRNVGPAAARNIAIERSTASNVCILDADDYFLPGRIGRLLGSADGEWDFLADDIIIVPERADDLSLSIPEGHIDQIILDPETFILNNISQSGSPRGELGFLKPIMRRTFLQRHDLRYDERLRLGEDYALYVQALMAGAIFRVVSPCGYIAVEREGSLSARHLASDLAKLIEFDAKLLRAGNLAEGERAALDAHRRATQRKYDYRRLLDLKQENGLPAALALAARVHRSLPFVLRETFRAKATRWSAKGPEERGKRYLIGPRLARLCAAGVKSRA